MNAKLNEFQGVILKKVGVMGQDILLKDRSKSIDLRTLANKVLTGQISIETAVNQFIKL